MGRIGGFFWRSDFFPRKLSFTREGKIVVLISIGLGFAAINTGNNLLYMVFGISLALIMISGFLSEYNIKSVRPSRMPQIRAEAGRPVSFLLGAANGNSRMSSFGIEVWPLFEGEGIVTEPSRFLELPPGASLQAPAAVTFASRGRYSLHGVVVSTSFPFSFFRKSAVTPASDVVTVHPRIHRMDDLRLPAAAEGEDESLPRAGRGFEFFGVRDFRTGDNPKNISHRLSAGKVQMIVREFEQTGNREVTIALVNVDPGGDDGPARAESAIEIAGSIAVHLLGQGRVVGLVSSFDVVSPGTGPAQADRILDYLATVKVMELNSPGEEIHVRSMLAGITPGAVVWVRPLGR